MHTPMSAVANLVLAAVPILAIAISALVDVSRFAA